MDGIVEVPHGVVKTTSFTRAVVGNSGMHSWEDNNFNPVVTIVG